MSEKKYSVDSIRPRIDQFLRPLLRQAGFKNIETSVVHREEEAPHFETLLAVGEK